MSDKIKISNNEAKNIAGRDINNFNLPQNTSQYLQNLYEKFKEEEANNPELKEIIAELDYYNSPGPIEMIGLEQKLQNGNRADFLWYAETVKEMYHKKLWISSQFSVTTQKINVYLLAAVRTCFMQEVYPLILEKQSRKVIDRAINEKIVSPLITSLGNNLLNYNMEDIQGMLYFLTGNCHIKWD